MIINKGRFSDLEFLEIYQQVNGEESLKDPTARAEAPNTKMQEIPNQIETQTNENRNITHTPTSHKKHLHKKKK